MHYCNLFNSLQWIQFKCKNRSNALETSFTQLIGHLAQFEWFLFKTTFKTMNIKMKWDSSNQAIISTCSQLFIKMINTKKKKKENRKSQIYCAHFSIYFIFEWVKDDLEIQSIEPKCNFFTHIFTNGERSRKRKKRKRRNKKYHLIFSLSDHFILNEIERHVEAIHKAWRFRILYPNHSQSAWIKPEPQSTTTNHIQ